MSRIFKLRNLIAAVVVTGALAIGSVQSASAGHYYTPCYYKTVITYDYVKQPYYTYVVKYDYYGCPYKVQVVDYRIVKIPVKRLVKVCY